MALMGRWSVDVTSEPGVLRLTLEGRLTSEEVAAFVEAHNRAIDSYGTAEYKVWVDMMTAEPLDEEAARIMERAKRYSSSRPNFQGSSVLVSHRTIALQHRLTSVRSGVMSTELISDDEAELREHLQKVSRRALARQTPGAPK